MSLNGKNGIAFLLAASFIWILITVIFCLPLDIYRKNILLLMSTGLMFPLSILISKLLKADWRFENNPLSDLGVYLNVAQIIYFPIVFWAMGHSGTEVVLFFAIITGAHFYPYGWYYNAKPYYIMSPIIAVVILSIGWLLNGEKLWVIPLAMVVLLYLLIFSLYVNYRKKYMDKEDKGH